jgi:hypothetical protein
MTTKTTDIAKYGHVASAVRAFLARKEWKPADLNEALGLDRSSAQPYNWIAGKGAPGPELRVKLGKLMHVAPETLAMRKLNQAPPAETRALAIRPSAMQTSSAPVLWFSVAADGVARIKLDLTLPIAQGGPLIRMLLDAGLVMGASPDE